MPSQGAAPGLQDLVSGGVEVVPCSIPEARAMIDAGKVRSLAIMDANPPALYPKVPTIKSELGTNWQIAAWRVIAAPKGIPADVQKTLVSALKKVYDSKTRQRQKALEQEISRLRPPPTRPPPQPPPPAPPPDESSKGSQRKKASDSEEKPDNGGGF